MTILFTDKSAKPISEDDLRTFEMLYEVTLPQDYKAYLLQHNEQIFKGWPKLPVLHKNGTQSEIGIYCISSLSWLTDTWNWVSRDISENAFASPEFIEMGKNVQYITQPEKVVMGMKGEFHGQIFYMDPLFDTEMVPLADSFSEFLTLLKFST